MKDDNAAAKPSQPRQVSVRLLGPAADITGGTVPAHILAGRRPRFFQIDGPAMVTVDLLGRKTVSLGVKAASIVTEVDVKAKTAVVVDIELLPLSESVSYREAVAEVRRLLHEMKIEPDERMQKRMNEWPDDSSSAKYRASMEFDKESGITVEVRPTPDDGWYIVVAFEVGVDARRALWDPTFKSTSEPPIEKKGGHRDSDSQ